MTTTGMMDTGITTAMATGMADMAIGDTGMVTLFLFRSALASESKFIEQ